MNATACPAADELDYQSYFSFSRKPFTNEAAGQYHNPALQDCFERLRQSLTTGCGLAVIIGTPGTGKTSLARKLAQTTAENAWQQLHLQATATTAAEFIPQLKEQLKTATAHEYSGRQRATVLLFVDEAQQLDDESLSALLTLRQTSTLNADKPYDCDFQLLLVGPLTLRQRLASYPHLLPEGTIWERLEPFSLDQVADYIAWQLKRAGHPDAQQDLFPAAVIGRIFQHSQGIPRLINTLCDRALLAAKLAEADKISSALIDEVAAALMVHSPALANDPDQTVTVPLLQPHALRIEPEQPETPLASCEERSSATLAITALAPAADATAQYQPYAPSAQTQPAEPATTKFTVEPNTPDSKRSPLAAAALALMLASSFIASQLFLSTADEPKKVASQSLATRILIQAPKPQTPTVAVTEPTPVVVASTPDTPPIAGPKPQAGVTTQPVELKQATVSVGEQKAQALLGAIAQIVESARHLPTQTDVWQHLGQTNVEPEPAQPKSTQRPPAPLNRALAARFSDSGGEPPQLTVRKRAIQQPYRSMTPNRWQFTPVPLEAG